MTPIYIFYNDPMSPTSSKAAWWWDQKKMETAKFDLLR